MRALISAMCLVVFLMTTNAARSSEKEMAEICDAIHYIGDMSLEAAASGFSRDDMIIAVRMNTEGGDPEILAILHPAFDRIIEYAFFNNRFGLSDAAQRECQLVEQLLLDLVENEPE